MSAAPVLFSQFRRINAHPGLMVDAQVWDDAHQYHRQQLHLHHLALHGWGIVQGLQVSIVPGAEDTLRIEPGLGIDPAGNFIVVSEPHTYHVTTRDKGAVYIVLQFREVLAEPAPPTPEKRATHPTRVIDAYRIQERDQLPNEPYLELARIERDPGTGSIAPAADPEHPRRNQLDLRSRAQLGSAPLPTIAAPSPALVMAAPDAGTANGSLEPRIDFLAEQVRQLGERLASLSSSAPPPPLPEQRRHSELVAADPQVEQLVARVETLARGLAALEQQAARGADAEALRQDLARVREQVGTLASQIAAQAPAQPAAPRVRLAVAQHGGQGWQAHRAGLGFLARELGSATSLIGEVLEPISAVDPRGVHLMYLSGYGALALDDAEVDGISRLLESNGVLVGEGCAGGPDGENGARQFAMAFVDLSNRLGRRLSKVDRAHPLMTARHVFGEPPAGARTTARVLEADGMLYSDADYGCAWQGGANDRPLPRATIRDALEFGVNLAVYRGRLTAS
jgi:Domain of unknown function (DUF4159)